MSVSGEFKWEIEMYKNGEIEKVMSIFEKSYQGRSRMDRETDRELWKTQQFYYQNGDTNDAFRNFINGYSYAKSLAIQGEFSEHF